MAMLVYLLCNLDNYALIHLSCPYCFRHGAVELEEEERKRQQERSAAFQGSGFRLGDSEGPSSVVAGTQWTIAKPVEKVASLSLSLSQAYRLDIFDHVSCF